MKLDVRSTTLLDFMLVYAQNEPSTLTDEQDTPIQEALQKALENATYSPEQKKLSDIINKIEAPK
jgi:ACT domain-containing protein